MLVLEVLLLHVGRHELGDIATALLAAGRAAHEGAESRGDISRHLEDAYAGRLALLTLHRGLAPPALVGHLLNLGGLLL